jgi:two-component system response regulator
MRKAILLVEDTEDDVVLTRRALKKNNLTNPLVIARDGQEALDYLLGNGGAPAGSGDLPAMILLDLKLPKIDGLEVLRRLRADARTRLVPVIILTSSKEERDLVEGYSNGANSYIRKPVDFEQFSEAVRQLGLYWLVLNESPPDVG